MKSEFSKTWCSSKQPRKQRKFLANAPNHIKKKQMSSQLDKPLKEKYNRNSIEVRKNDEVKIMRGRFKRKMGKVIKLDIKNTRIQIDGINRTKKDGEKIPFWVHPSKVKIIKLDDTDKKRIKARQEIKKEEKKQENKPETKQETHKKSKEEKKNAH